MGTFCSYFFLGAHTWIVHCCRTGILLGKTRALLPPCSTPTVTVTVRVHASDRGDERPLVTWVRFRYLCGPAAGCERSLRSPSTRYYLPRDQVRLRYRHVQSLLSVCVVSGCSDQFVSLPSMGLHFARVLMAVGLVYRWTEWIAQCDNGVSTAQ